MSGLNRLSATAAARKLATREISAVALLEDCLARIAAREPVVHAWTFLDPEAARRRARELDAQGPAGLLHGIPIAVKDLFDTCAMPSSYGSPIYADHRPAADASSVALARAAGAIVVGKTVTTEFATFHPGPTCNPHNPLHTPGGSSSGSAAAVADWMVPLAFGTQTAGSIVRPAAYCGVVGYKPTFGTVNRVGVKMISDTLDTVGALARTVPDVALFVAALADRPELTIGRPLGRPPRVGVCRTHQWDRAHPETVTAFEDAARCLGKAGASLRDVVLPPQFADRMIPPHIDPRLRGRLEQNLQQPRAMRARPAQTGRNLLVVEIQQRPVSSVQTMQPPDRRRLRQQRFQQTQLLQHLHAGRLKQKPRPHRQVDRRPLVKRHPVVRSCQQNRRRRPGGARADDRYTKSLMGHGCAHDAGPAL